MRRKDLKIWTILCSCFLLILGALPLSPTSTSANTNQPLLHNGDLEAELENGMIVGWEVDPATASYGSASVTDSVYSRSGTKSLLFEDKVNGASPAGSFRVLSNPIPVATGDTVTYDIYVYKEKAADQSHGIQPVIHYFKADGTQVKTNDFLNYGKDAVPVGAWFKLTLSKVVPAGTSYIKVGLYSGFPSLTKLYADDASVTITPAAPEVYPTQLLNASFDLPLSNGQIPGWTLAAGTSGLLEYDTSISYSAPQSLHFVDTDPLAGLRVMSDKVAVTPGESITVSSQVYVIEQSHNIAGEVYFYNSQNTQVGTTHQVLFGSVTLGKEVWTQMRMFETVPAGAAYARIAFYSGAPSLTNAYFDDVAVEVIPPEVPLDRTYGAPVDLGPLVHVNLGQSGAIQTNANGENEVYFVTNGLPGTFYAVDGETGKLKFSEAIPSTEATWAMTVGSDKNVYFASTMNGMLYRYLPTEKKVEALGYNTADNWVWDIEEIDGKIYGGTYNPDSYGKLFEYDIAAQTFRNYGVVQSGQQYVRGIAVDENYIYAGLGTTVQLFKVNRVTGEKSEIVIPGHTGSTNTIADVFKVGSKLFVSVSTINMVVWDLETNTIDSTFTYSNMISEPYPDDPNLIYYKDLTKLYKYDIAAKQSTEIPLPLPLPDTTRVKDMSWIKMKSGEKAGKTVLAMVTQYGEYMLYDPADQWISFVQLEISPQPVRIQSLDVGFDGRVYLGGYQRGMSIYNPFTNKLDLNLSSFAQPEGIGFMNDKVYYGTYVSAVMYSYDPTKPAVLNENPKYEYKISHQDRPFAITSGDNKLFVGTVPDYGFLGGSLAIYDEATDTWTEFDHTKVVKDQSIIGLAYKDGLLYGSTTVWGGLGIDPSEPAAKIFVWDVASGRKIDEFTPVIPTIDETPRMIGEISFGPDGLLWGAVDGTIFAMDVTNKQVVKSKLIRPSTYNTSKWLPIHLRWAPDGMLYTTLSRKIIAVDPETLRYKIIENNFLNSMTIGIDGSIYYAPDAGTKLSRIAIPETDATLSAITVNGQPLQGFSPGILKYSRTIATGAVEATATQAGATIAIEDLRDTERKTIIHVTGTDGKSKLDYVIHWTAPPSNPGSSGTPASPGTPSETQVVDTLVPNNRGAIVVDIADSSTAVVLPNNSGDLVGNKPLVLKGSRLSLEIAPEVLKQLQAQLTDGRIPNLKVSFNELEQADQQAALDRVSKQVIGEVKADSGIFEIDLGIESFEKPISVSFPVKDGANVDLLGIFLIEKNGTLAYAGGKVKDGAVTADITKSGKYVALEIDKSFDDVPDRHWAHQSIKIMAAKLIAKGKTDSLFAPGAPITRAEFVSLITRSLGLTAASAAPFADVSDSSWYAPAVAAAVEAGVIKGLSDTTFAPDRTITREEMAAIAVRAYQILNSSTPTPAGSASFADQDNISGWAQSYVMSARNLGLISGRSNNSFVPQAQLTRAEAIQSILNLLGKQ